MPDPQVFGVVSFADQNRPRSLFTTTNVGLRLSSGKTQFQVLVDTEGAFELYATLRFPKGMDVEAEKFGVPLTPDLFRSFAADCRIHMLFGARMKDGPTATSVNPTLSAVLEGARRIQRVAERVLQKSVLIRELFQDLAGGVWATAILAGVEEVYLFYRGVGAMFRGAAGWYVTLTGASHVSIYLGEIADTIVRESARTELFGVPIRRVVIMDLPTFVSASNY